MRRGSGRRPASEEVYEMDEILSELERTRAQIEEVRRDNFERAMADAERARSGKVERKSKMREFWSVIQAVFAAVGGWLGYFLGGWDGALYALIAFITIDYVTGVMRAVVEKKLSSEIGFKGTFRKVVILALVGVGSILDRHVIGSGGVMRTAVIFYYLSNEGISILENATYLGLPVPEKLKGVLEQLRSDKPNAHDEN